MSEKTKQTKRRVIIACSIVAALIIIAVGGLFCCEVQVLSYGCRCGCRREWMSFSHAPEFIKRVKVRYRVLDPGDPEHNHEFWDAQLADVGDFSLLWTHPRHLRAETDRI